MDSSGKHDRERKRLHSRLFISPINEEFDRIVILSVSEESD